MKQPPFNMIAETKTEKWRYETFWAKEPETLKWIEGFGEQAIFFDVGANVGIYSLYAAALHPRATVFSFEPDLLNYKRLVENIELNDFYNICPVHAAIGAYFSIGRFNAKSTEAGSSGGQFGFTKDEHDKEFIPLKKYPVMSIDMDAFAEASIYPTHIKIDVDGLESNVVMGMLRNVLQSTFLKSVLIELNRCAEDIKRIFYNNGFTLDSELNFLPDHSRVRRTAEGITAENLIFTRQ